jgi:3-methyladenine DNA glycosylase AlkD
MARFGIASRGTLGVPIPVLRKLAREIGKDHPLAIKLWSSGIHEARILAGMIDQVEKVTPAQMDRWAKQFDSWDVCDQVCMNLFWKTPVAYGKAVQWSHDDHEFVKRAGFALMACLAWHDDRAADRQFERFFTVICREASDDRNFVKKSVNWALRQIGKRNRALNVRAVKVARQMLKSNSKATRWIASDALRELTNSKVRLRIRARELRD